MATFKTAYVVGDPYYTEPLYALVCDYFPRMIIRHMHFECTEEDQQELVDTIVRDESSKVVFLVENHNDLLAKKVALIRKTRKDIFLCVIRVVGIEYPSEYNDLYHSGLKYCKENSCNLVMMIRKGTHKSIIAAPEETYYHPEIFWEKTLKGLVEMAALRSALTFTRSTEKPGEPIPWDSELVPNSLRTVVNYCIDHNAYKRFNGVTAGHFAIKLNDNTFLTSIRKSDFNYLNKVGLVKVETDGDERVIAYGAKPSVGGQSQRIVFRDHPEYDCIVHFHSPMKNGSQVPIKSQREYECGSHACGRNTSQGLKKFGNLSAVYLDNHGPNIVFNKDIDPQEVIDFIEANFELSKKTGEFNPREIREKMMETV